MKKILYLTLILSLFCTLSFPSIAAEDSFEPIAGESFTYEVLTSTIDVKVRSKEHHVDTYSLTNTPISTDIPVNVAVTGVNASIANYTVTCGTYERNAIMLDDTLMYSVYLSQFIHYADYVGRSLAYSMNEYGNFSISSYGAGLPIDILYFIAPNESNWDYLESMANTTAAGIYFVPQEGFDFFRNASYTEIANVVYFETFATGYYEWSNGLDSDIRANLDNGFLCAYNKSTGALLGMRIKGRYKGRIDGIRVDCSINFHIEHLNFDLHELTMYTENIPAAGVVIVSLGLLFVTIIFYRKKKNH